MGATCCPGLCYDPVYGQFGQGAYGQQQFNAYGQPCVGGVCPPGGYPGQQYGGVQVQPGYGFQQPRLI